VPMGLSVVATTVFSIYTYRREQRRRADAEQAYAERLIELGHDLHQAHDQQRRFYDYNYPDAHEALSIAHLAQAYTSDAGSAVRAITRLWERRVADEDFGLVRLGLGTLPSTVVYTLGDNEEVNSAQARAARKLAEDSRFVAEVPVTIALRQPAQSTDPSLGTSDEEETPRFPVTPSFAIAGESSQVYAFTRALLAHAIVFHAPTDLRLFLCAAHREPWDWAEQLPHCRADEQAPQLFFFDALRAQATAAAVEDVEESGEEERFFEGLRKLLTQRQIRLQEREASQDQGSPILPFCLIVVDMLADAGHSSPLSAVESDPAISILLAEGATLGAAVIFLVNERSKAPGGCHAVIETEKTTPNTNSKLAQTLRPYFRYAEIGVNSFRYVGVADQADLALMRQLAAVLATLDMRQGPGSNLPTTVPFLDLEGFRTLTDLRAAAQQRWSLSEQLDERANWLRVPLGRMAGNKTREMVFSARRDGVHGIVAGSTGSGKSELLIALISGLAVNYSPATLNFVLVDYKGGGAFSEFAGLPHCVDIITNLAADGVTRMFTAISAEMQRRQRLNTATRTKNIVEYRRKGYHRTFAPYPFLFIIIDEFAEMIADRAEYKSQLESITRVGRAQGVSLILAAQRPSGVTDQMRSNIKFRICLRVETPPESREMLRRPDAAFLPPGIPGRGYLQVGNENIELIQVAYCGGRGYATANRAKVIWPLRGGGYDPAQDQEPPELYKAIIGVLDDLATRSAVPPQAAPWPHPLPRTLALAQRLTASDPRAEAITDARYLDDESREHIRLGQPGEPDLTLAPALNRWLNGGCGWVEPLDIRYAMRPVVGLVDDPYAARQLPLVVELQRGHAVIFGASGWGKSTFLRTMALSLAASHSPNQFQLYVLDLGGRSQSVLEKLPHTGALISPDEESYKERVTQLIRRLNELIETRKTLISAAAVENIYAYNQATPTSGQPGVLVLIDNILEFVESFRDPGDAPESILDQFIAMARQARTYGIHLAISAGRIEDLPSQFANLFSERFTLKLNDPSEYRAVLGAAVEEPGAIPGRGYTRIGMQPLAFQVALPLDLRRQNAPAASEGRELERLVQLISAEAQREQASGRSFRPIARVEPLPRKVLLRALLVEQHNQRIQLDHSFLAALRQLTAERWAASIQPEHADWLNVALGVAAGGRTRMLRFEAKVDGVHAMVAGGTGAGKSELLMTLIVDLALRYDPSVLNFVLVDYKGGGAFAPFAQLPHCVDSISNLNPSAVRRVFTAIRAELERRQTLLREDGDIVSYRSKGRHQGPNGQPLPFLMIIIDEYAEMITDNPAFGAELDRITRLGRSLGVHLILASQRPVGVSDQMRANIKLRICLRVEGVDTSREMLRRADAAFLPNGMPGRGYLQVGNEGIELIQVAFAGDHDAYGQLNERGEPARFYETVVQLAGELLSGPRPQAPWPPFLPPALTFGELTPSAASAPPAPLPLVAEWLRGRSSWPTIRWDEQFLHPVIGLLDDPAAAYQGPLSLDLPRGHVAVFGVSGAGKSTLLRSLAVSLAASYFPGAVQIHALDLDGRDLEPLRALPHVGTIISPDERGYEERVQQLFSELSELVDQRKALFSERGVSSLIEYNRSGPKPIAPAVVVLIDNVVELIESFSAGRDTPDGPFERFVALARQGRQYGLHFVVTAPRPAALSSKLFNLFTERFSLRMASADDYSAVIGNRPDELEELPGRGLTRLNGRTLSFQVALVSGALDSEGRVRDEIQSLQQLGAQIQTAISTLGLRFNPPLRIQALPTRVLYREVLARTSRHPLSETNLLDELRELVRTAWSHHCEPANANWLQATPGMIAGERPRTLTLSAKADGVHGLIAGGTGSGKSELLMTLIIGMALSYSPEQLTFVLVDFKGGGSFKPFEQLPHCVDVVTNLNRAAVQRMFTAIEAEIRRRQALNAEAGVSDIIDYRKRGYHQSKAPYPHLVIIIDEYAELIDTNPEYRQQLDSITRVGRSLGINLILASQRPRGVSDQMRANIKLRLCLRVEEIETSREMLRRPDAALLPSISGRGVLQVGNEGGELIQIAYVGAEQPDLREPAVQWPGRPVAVPASGETPRFYDRVVELTRTLARTLSIPRPWHAELPARLSLESPIHDVKNQRILRLTPAVSDWINGELDALWPGLDWSSAALRAAVGLIDDPLQADQRPLWLDLSHNHLAVFGDPGSGRSSFLRTIVTALAATHSPDELHLYVLDLGGRGFRSLEGLPHMGAVLYADDDDFEERLQRLFEVLSITADQRQRQISDAGCSTLYEYNARHPDQTLPAILVLLDSFIVLREGNESLVDNTLLPLVRRSLAVGISFVAACNGPNSLGSRLYALFGERISFTQTDPDRYMDIVGRGALPLDGQAGRGYMRASARPLLFQAALPVGFFPAEQNLTPLHSEAENLARLVQMMDAQATIGGRRSAPPDPIKTLAEQIALSELLAEVGPAAAGYARVALGQNGSLRPVLVDLQQLGPHFLITGPPLSGKTTVLRTWVLALAQRYSPTQARLVLIDPQARFADYSGKHSLARLPHVLSELSEAEQLESLLVDLEREAAALKAAGDERPQLFILIDNFEEFQEMAEAQKQTRRLVQLARSFGRYGLHFVVAGGIEQGSSDLRRAVLASGFGLGLRTAPAIEALKVMRLPTGLRDRVLPLGRGYMVKAGQASLLQVATPYPNVVQSSEDEPTEVSRRIAVALDAWCSQLHSRWFDQKARWLPGPAEPAATTSGLPAHEQGTLGKLRDHLQKYARYELAALRAGEIERGTLIERLLQPDLWEDRAAVLALAREALDALYEPSLREVMHSVNASMDEGALVDALSAELAKLPGNGITPSLNG
jgi:DNA segregation ATPase FtsK/SpoIIIE, S-DNA-T family